MHEEGREGFDATVPEEECSSIALEDNVTLVEIDGQYEIIKADIRIKAYLLQAQKTKPEKLELPVGRVDYSF